MIDKNPPKTPGVVYIGNGIHGPCLFTWNEVDEVWMFKHVRACWWEMSPITSSIDRYKPTTNYVFGHRADFWKGKEIENI